MRAFNWGWIGIAFFLGIAVGVGGLAMMNRVQPTPIIIQPPPTSVPTATPGPLRVFVNGQVAAPDVYQLPPGSILQAAVAAAGGLTNEADTAVINLALPLQDGMHVYVPAEGEMVAEPINMAIPGDADLGSEGMAVPGTGGNPINLNTATLEELDSLPGIGPSTAQKIIEHRETNGPFATIEAIMDVSGIGPAKFEAIQELITVGN
jgi:competence protein ComEA